MKGIPCDFCDKLAAGSITYNLKMEVEDIHQVHPPKHSMHAGTVWTCDDHFATIMDSKEDFLGNLHFIHGIVGLVKMDKPLLRVGQVWQLDEDYHRNDPSGTATILSLPIDEKCMFYVYYYRGGRERVMEVRKFHDSHFYLGEKGVKSPKNLPSKD